MTVGCNLPSPFRWLLAAAAACVFFSASPMHVGAQTAPDDGTRAAARELAEEGIDAYLVRDFPKASQKLEKAYRLFATPTLGLWSARALLERGLLVEAAERFRETQRLPASVGDSAIQRSALRDAATELEALLPRLAAVTIQLRDADSAGVRLSLDGAEISTEMLDVRRPMNPGAHQIAAIRGSQRRDVQVQLAEAEHKVVELHLSTLGREPSAAEVSPANNRDAKPAVSSTAPPLTAATQRSADVDAGSVPLRALSITTLALGGAALATSGITALVASGECAGGRCASSTAQHKYDPLRTVSSVTFWSGAALAVGGVFAWWFAVSDKVTPDHGNISWMITPVGVSVGGTL